MDFTKNLSEDFTKNLSEGVTAPASAQSPPWVPLVTLAL